MAFDARRLSLGSSAAIIMLGFAVCCAVIGSLTSGRVRTEMDDATVCAST